MDNSNYYSQIFELYNFTKKQFFESDTEWLYRIVEDRLEVFEYNKLKHHQEIINYFLNSRNQIINVFIVGEGNFGKSTLINSIVKGNVAKIDFLPSTWCIHRYLFGRDKAVVYLAGNEARELTREEAKNFLDEEEKKTKENKAYVSPVLQVDWYYSEYEVLQRFVLVDTPGLAQLRAVMSDRSIEEYYYKADCVLWLIDAGRINSESTYKNINQVSRFTKKIIGVINKWDSLTKNVSEEQKLEVQARALEQANKIYGPYFSCLQPVSAKLACDNLLNKDSYCASRIPELIRNIEVIFLKNNVMDKNIHFYHTIRLAFNESSNILENEHITHLENIKLYSDNKEHITNAKNLIISSIFESAKPIYDNFYNGIYKDVYRTVHHSNVDNMLHKVILDKLKINSNIDQVFAEAKMIRDKEYYNLIQYLASKQYKNILYKYDGSILSRDELSNLSEIPNLSREIQYSIDLDIKVSFGTKFMVGLAEMFSNFGFAREYKRDKTRELHEKIISSISLHAENNWRKIKIAVENNLDTCFAKLIENYEKQFKFHFESFDKLIDSKDDINNKLNLSRVSNFLYAHLILNILRRKN
jgi:predicted GTPase